MPPDAIHALLPDGVTDFVIARKTSKKMVKAKTVTTASESWLDSYRPRKIDSFDGEKREFVLHQARRLGLDETESSRNARVLLAITYIVDWHLSRPGTELSVKRIFNFETIESYNEYGRRKTVSRTSHATHVSTLSLHPPKNRL